MTAVCKFCLLLILTVNIYGHPMPDSRCGGNAADIVFLVDSSSSIGRRNFRQYVRPFLHDVVKEFDVGPGSDQTRVGITTFSDLHNLQFHLNQFVNKAELMENILNIPIYGGNTNTSEALTFVADEMFREQNGGRKGATHIIVILTDGVSQDTLATREAAKKAHKMGYNVFAIGVGSLTDEEELSDLASDPDSEFKFKVDDFKALDKLKSNLTERTCEVTTVRAPIVEPTTPMPTTARYTDLGEKQIRTIACGGKPAEVYFILDSSGSINKSDFSITTLDFVRSVSSLFDVGPERNQTRVGIVTFSDDVRHIFPLNAHTSRGELMEAISPENIPHLAEGTNTADALRFLQETGFAPDAARPDVVHIAIVITDGQSENVEATVAAATAAHRSGVKVFAIGVGKAADVKELTDIASEPESTFVFTVPSYAALMSIRNLLAIRTCTVEDYNPIPQDQAECGLDNARMLFLFDSFSLGLKATRIISTEASQMSARLSRRVENLSAGLMAESCPSKLDMDFRNAATFARQAMHIQDTAESKLVSIMKDARRKKLDRKYKAGRQIMVVYVDETSLENGRSLKSQASYAKHFDVEIYVVAIGDVNQKLVNDIASKPSDDYVVNVDSARNLPKLRNTLMNNFCHDQTKPETENDAVETTKKTPKTNKRVTLPPPSLS